MTTDRAPTARRCRSTEAVAELRRCSGTQFDPNVVDALLARRRRSGLAADACASRCACPLPSPCSVPAGMDAGTHARPAAHRGLAGERIDTVLLALTDMQGRLQGKRLTARHFLDEVLATAPRRATTCSPSTSR